MYTSKFARFVLLTIVGGFFTISCHDQLLNPEPSSVLTTANFYNSASDINVAVLGTYNRLQSRWVRDYIVLETATDNMYAEYYATTNGLDQIELLDISSDNHEVNVFWQNTYNGIFRANSVLNNLDRPDDYQANQREQYEGEARFLRAHFYFDLVRTFGGVPKVETIQTIAEAKDVPRSTEEEIYSLIIDDLTDAVNLLPGPDGIEHGRASRAAAEALLGKVYVYRDNYSQARGYLENVLNNYSYDLVDDYGDLFNIDTEMNSEAIFSLAFLQGTNDHNLSHIFIPNEGLFGYSNRGSRITRPTWDLHKRFHEDDTRFENTMWEYFIPASGSADDEPTWYPFFSKFLVPNLGGSSSGLDLPILRLADVILLYSEVLYDQEGPEQALLQLNRVRERAFGDDSQNYTLADIATADDFIDVLLEERRFEFVLENERWFDIVRMDRLVDILGGELEAQYNPSTGSALIQQVNAEPHMRYFPIPREQINISSPGVMHQNPGYDGN